MRFIVGGYAQGKFEYAKGILENALIIDETNYSQYIGENMSRANYGANDGAIIGANDGANDGACLKQGIIINKLHLIIREMLKQMVDENVDVCDDEPIKEITRRISAFIESKTIIIICDEIGNGIVPMDKFDRLHREVTGRVAVEIAKMADCVERVTCGIPMRLK